jgi:demethylmenaquinone methyltransferase/2-methoxy-6-polyprenyl-1,4-benzoquinol methylase
MKFLDVAGGTGDIAFRIWNKAKNENKDIEIIISDINDEMLEEGRKKAIDKGYLSGIDWQQANAEELPFKDEEFDYYTIAFGIRNVTHIDKALKDAYRVLKPGGKFVCMEFSNVENPLFRKIYDVFSFEAIPRMGDLIAGDKESYQYLVESIRKFPPKEEFSRMIRSAGFKKISVKSFNHGVVAIHTGVKE